MSLRPDPTLSPIPAAVRELAARREWKSLVAGLLGVPLEQLLEEPEVAFLYADACRRTGDPVRALEVGEAVEALVRRSGDYRLLLRVLNVIGMSLFEMGRTPEADHRFSELLDSASEWGDEESAARASNNLGVLANVRGRRDLALTYYQRALASYQRLGQIRGLAQTHLNLGISYRDLGFRREADAHFGRAIEHAETARSDDVTARAEMERAALRAREGDGPLAESMARRALQRFERLGDPAGAADAVRVLAAAARATGDDAAATELLERAFATARTTPDPLLRAEVQRDRGLLLRDLGQPEAAREALADAARCFDQLGATADAATVRALLGTL